jgi:hypothetical protein
LPEGPLLPGTSDNADYFSAPLVALVRTDVEKLTPTELEHYLRQIREMRGNHATRKAKTEIAPSKNRMAGLL